MANCRIVNIKPPCGYRLDGIGAIRLLDYDDFIGFAFNENALYDNCLVTEVRHNGVFAEIGVSEAAEYSSSLEGGIYAHTLTTFVAELSAAVQAQLHLASKRRFVAVFKTKAGRQFVFGYEAGATVTYVNQTADGTGSLLTISAASRYPLFEIVQVETRWGDFINIWADDSEKAVCTWGDFINVWAWARAYSNAYSNGYE